MRATARDMRYHLRSVMSAVARGETVYVTHRGRVKAKIVAAESDIEVTETPNPFLGVWQDRDDMTDVASYVRALRQGRFG